MAYHGLAFRGTHSSSFPFLLINSIKRSMLPSVENRLTKVPERAGAYDYGNEIGVRKFKIEITILASDELDLDQKVDQLTEWLLTKKSQELILDNNTNKTYYGKLDGSTDLEEIVSVGFGTLTFVCPDPYAYGAELETEVLGTNTTTDLTINGNTSTFPRIEIDVTQDTSFLAFTTSNSHILLGKPKGINAAEVPKRERVLHDTMQDASPWTTATNVDYGTITGFLESNGYSIHSQHSTDGQYGTGSEWHGAAGIRGLGETLTNFEVTAEIGFDSTSADQMGRVELYLLDTNGNHIGKMHLRDGSSYKAPYAFARAGDVGSGKQFVGTYGDYRGVWANWDSGIMRIGRRGGKWFSYFAMKDANGRHHTKLYETYDDVAGVYADELAQVQIHIAAHNTTAPINDMWIGDIKVDKFNDIAQADTPYIALNGDKIIIDNSTGEVLKNGEGWYEDLDPTSDFIELDKSTTQIALQPAPQDVGAIKIYHRDRWL